MARSITCAAQRFRKLRAVASLLLVCAMSVACREPELRTLRSTLHLRSLPGCAPEPGQQVVVEALGDFAADSQALAASRIELEPVHLSDLPVAAQWFRLSVAAEGFRGAALGRAGDAGEVYDALLLPLATACSVLEQSLDIFPGSALGLLAGQDLLIAGGHALGQREATDQTLLARVAEPSLAPADKLIVPRVGAAAIAQGGEVWLLGGALDLPEGSAAFDTFERFDAATQAFARPGRLHERRYAPGAVSLLDGRALVAGGSATVAGEPLASIEVIAADGTRAELWQDELPFAATELSLHALDDGSVVALGRLADGRARLALLDPGSRAAKEHAPPALSEQQRVSGPSTVALPGARLALIELASESQQAPDAWQTTGRLHLLLADGSYLVLADWLGSFEGLSRARALALRDGRILLTGLRAGLPTARILDLNHREVAMRLVELEIEALFMREDGSVLLVGEQGLRVLREDTLTQFDNPGGTLIADDSGALCLDAYGRFVREGLGLRAALRGARFDLASLRYQDVQLDLTLTGKAQLLLRREDGEERSIELGGDTWGPAFCQLAAVPGEPLQIVREGQNVSLRAGHASRTCVLDGLTGSIAIGLVALEVDTLVTDLRVERR